MRCVQRRRWIQKNRYRRCEGDYQSRDRGDAEPLRQIQIPQFGPADLILDGVPDALDSSRKE
jgi:hypothetical protein